MCALCKIYIRQWFGDADMEWENLYMFIDTSVIKLGM
jgi:hypothetical protein